MSDRLRSKDWEVRNCPLGMAKHLVRTFHYAKGCSNTAVYSHGLYRKSDGRLMGAALWLPPTRICCESVNKENWTKVLSLSRLVCLPDCPKNAASFLIGGSIKLIENEGRFISLVTYADEYREHTGAIYKATNWKYVGVTAAYPKWVDASGRQVSTKATKSRTVAQMHALGFTRIGKYRKHKFVKHLRTHSGKSANRQHELRLESHPYPPRDPLRHSGMDDGGR